MSEIVGTAALTNGIVGSRDRLKELEVELNQDKALRKAVLQDIAVLQARGFQDFERVGEVGTPCQTSGWRWFKHLNTA